MFLLDTNVISELRKAGDGKADDQVVGWSRRVDPELLHVSVVTILEIALGVQEMEARDPRQGALRQWLDERVLPAFVERTLDIDTKVALRCAALHRPARRPERDALIAATALVHGMTVVTRNVEDFSDTGVALLDPWSWPVTR